MSPAGEQILQRKLASFQLLQEMAEKLYYLPQHIHFSATQLEAFNVIVSPLNLEADRPTVDGESQFFKPMPVSQFKKLPRSKFEALFFKPDDHKLHNADALHVGLSNYLCDELPESIQTEERGVFLDFSKWRGGFSQKRGHRFGGNEFGFRPEEQCEWRFDECYDTTLEEYPHLMSYTLSGYCQGSYPDTNAESQLTRGEVIMMIDIILKRMPSVQLAFHDTYPVLMISCFSRKLRFIQGYFDGAKLRLQYSEFLDFSKFKQETFDLFLRWAMNEPIGDTKATTESAVGEPVAIHTSSSAAIRAH